MKPADLRWVSRDEVFADRPHAAEGLKLEGLWVAGSLAGLARHTVAVVGTRAPSDGGRRRAHEFGFAFARAGVCVISGLALGIDGAAHAGAIEGSGVTIGVLGGGHHEFYPKRNRQLAEAMLANGGAVVSPFAPDDVARPPQFLQRNGIVAALAEAVVVVEAAERSGALNTAGWAAARSSPVFALPGDVDRLKAAGCNALIRDGATLVRNAADVLADLGFASGALELRTRPDAPATREDPLESTLLAALTEPRDLESLLDAARAPTGAVLAALMRLEIDALVERRGDGTFARLR
jgi:DNA processing protein